MLQLDWSLVIPIIIERMIELFNYEESAIKEIQMLMDILQQGFTKSEISNNIKDRMIYQTLVIYNDTSPSHSKSCWVKSFLECSDSLTIGFYRLVTYFCMCNVLDLKEDVLPYLSPSYAHLSALSVIWRCHLMVASASPKPDEEHEILQKKIEIFLAENETELPEAAATVLRNLFLNNAAKASEGYFLVEPLISGRLDS